MGRNRYHSLQIIEMAASRFTSLSEENILNE